MKNLFKSKFTMQNCVRTQDAHGTWTEVWTNVTGLIDTPCRLNWLKGISRGESIINGKVEWVRDAKLYTSYSTGIKIDDRLVYNSENYNVINIADFDEINKYMTLDIKRSS